jgi:hypothetical protein
MWDLRMHPERELARRDAEAAAQHEFVRDKAGNFGDMRGGKGKSGASVTGNAARGGGGGHGAGHGSGSAMLRRPQMESTKSPPAALPQGPRHRSRRERIAERLQSTLDIAGRNRHLACAYAALSL